MGGFGLNLPDDLAHKYGRRTRQAKGDELVYNGRDLVLLDLLHRPHERSQSSAELRPLLPEQLSEAVDMGQQRANDKQAPGHPVHYQSLPVQRPLRVKAAQ